MNAGARASGGALDVRPLSPQRTEHFNSCFNSERKKKKSEKMPSSRRAAPGERRLFLLLALLVVAVVDLSSGFSGPPPQKPHHPTLKTTETKKKKAPTTTTTTKKSTTKGKGKKGGGAKPASWSPHRGPVELAKMPMYASAPPPVEVLGVVDFECTCERGPNNGDYEHELIEFPCVLVDAQTLQVMDEFHSYVRPTENRTLSRFCQELTGISQRRVDAAPTLPVVLNQLDAFLEARNLVAGPRRFAFTTDGWDLHHFLDAECRRKGIAKAKYFEEWVDVTKHFDARRTFEYEVRHLHKRPSKYRTSLKKMLRHYKMNFKGEPHSGIDDARNIARVALRLLREHPLSVNDSLASQAAEQAKAKAASSSDQAKATNAAARDVDHRRHHPPQRQEQEEEEAGAPEEAAVVPPEKTQ